MRTLRGDLLLSLIGAQSITISSSLAGEVQNLHTTTLLCQLSCVLGLVVKGIRPLCTATSKSVTHEVFQRL